METKKDLMKEIDSLVQEYLGGYTIKMYRDNWPKKKLLAMRSNFREMVFLKKRAMRLRKNRSSEEILTCALFGEKPSWLIESAEYLRQANEIWLEY